ncbi:hypothetical protein PR048_018545 [Dryococelus australis]|uniref:Uncharacterized protein n=1 Tax=Dryococelus australis TaxID=614101 RepID=A0ABQ9HCK5_9NEOP|nr:hypothetical protein PR048_018545 [Dryococelus australis]
MVIEYSVKQDAVFCFVCRHFAVKYNLCEDVLLHGYSDWKHIGNMATKHENSKIRKLSLANSKLNNMPQNAKYTSNMIQNDMLQAAASVITQVIVRKIKSGSTVYSRIVDEARDEGLTEQINICLKQLNVFSNSVGLDITNCVSQSFDGASVITGALNEVLALIRHMANNPWAYVHCHAHRLNLVLVDVSENLQFVGETIGLLEAIYAFQYSSTLRYNVFMKSETSCGLDKLNVPQHSDTRWVSKCKGIHFFKLLFQCVVKALEECSKSAKKKEAAEQRVYFVKEIARLRTEDKFDKLYNEAMQISESCNILTPSPSVTGKSIDFNTSSSSRKQTINIRLADYFVTESVGKGKVCACTQDDITDKCRLRSIQRCVSACDPTLEFFMNSAILGSLAEAYNTDNDTLILLKTTGQQYGNSFSRFTKCTETFLVMPMSTTSAERSFSGMKGIKTYLRANMTRFGFHFNRMRKMWCCDDKSRPSC